MTTFGKRLKELRSSKKLTQKELGDILNLSESAVSMYERDEREPSFETMKKLSELFEVSRAYLLGDTDDPKESKPSSAFHDFDNITEEEKKYLELQLDIFRKMKEGSNT